MASSPRTNSTRGIVRRGSEGTKMSGACARDIERDRSWLGEHEVEGARLIGRREWYKRCREGTEERSKEVRVVGMKGKPGRNEARMKSRAGNVTVGDWSSS